MGENNLKISYAGDELRELVNKFHFDIPMLEHKQNGFLCESKQSYAETIIQKSLVSPKD